MLNVGKLYQIKKYFWLLYPSKDIAAAADDDARSMARTYGDAESVVLPLLSVWLAAVWTDELAAFNVAFYSKKFKCNVTYIPENGIFCLLEQDGKYLKVLAKSGEVGWIVYPENDEWTKGTIEEVKE